MGRLLVKPTVKPAIVLIAAAVANVAQTLTWDVVITSGNDSTHKVGSKHYTNAALDVRTKNFPTHQSKLDFIEALRAKLPGHDLILESVGKVNEHLHIEHDPK